MNICVYINIYACVCRGVYMYSHLQTYRCDDNYADRFVYASLHMHTYIHMYIRSCACGHAFIHVHAYTLTHVKIHVCINVCNQGQPYRGYKGCTYYTKKLKVSYTPAKARCQSGRHA